MRSNRWLGIASFAVVTAILVGCGTSPDEAGDVDVAAPSAAALTSAQVAAARQAGLIPSTYVTPTFFDPVGNFGVNASDYTTALRINKDGAVAGFTQRCSPLWPAGCPASPFYVDPAGVQRLLPNAQGSSSYVTDINDVGDLSGYGGPGGGDIYRGVLYHGPSSYDLLPVFTPVATGGAVRAGPLAINNVPGTSGRPAMAANALYVRGGALGVWQFSNNGQDALGRLPLTLPANQAFDTTTGPRGAAIVLDGNTCLSRPAEDATSPYYGPGITMMAWVKPDASMCPGGPKVIVARQQGYVMSLTCNSQGGVSLTGQVWNYNINVTPPLGNIPFGQWRHVALSSDSFGIRGYIDGQLVAPQGTAPPAVQPPYNFAVGCRTDVPASYFKGALDELAVFDVPMGTEQVRRYFQGTPGYRVSATHHHWSRYKDGFFEVLLGPADSAYNGDGYVAGLDDQGRMAGLQFLAGGVATAVVYDPTAGWINLNTLIPADSGWSLDGANAINNAGQVIGTGTHNGRESIFRLDLDSHEVIDLQHLTEGPWTNPSLIIVARDINSQGHVVGAVMDNQNFWPQRAIIYTDELGLTDLNNFIDPAAPGGWTLLDARGMNDRDEVVGLARNAAGQYRGYKMKVPIGANAQQSDVAAIVPRVVGIATVSGQTSAIFAYHNDKTTNVFVARGSLNALTDGLAQPSAVLPPEWFAAGDSGKPFAAPVVGGSLTWKVGNNTATANAGSPSLPVAVSPAGVHSAVLPDGSKVALESEMPDIGSAGVVDTSASAGPGLSVGRTDGRFEVTDDGAASYRIPLWVPEGRNGVQPHLALAYSSRGGDGALGLGWHVEGFSSISRCKRDYARDGKPRAIQFDDQDRLCLDGQRLVLVSGTYNQNGAEYRTEKDQFSKILQVGADGEGPTGFLVYLRDGTRRSYGNAATSVAGYRGDSTAFVQGNPATVVAARNNRDEPTVTYNTHVRLSWLLASERDRYENEVRYQYVTTSGGGDTLHAVEVQPARIDYTYREGLSYGVADRTILFQYNLSEADGRFDARDSFVSGLQLLNARTLRRIQVKGPDPVAQGLLREYRLDYQNENGKRLLLTSFSECDGKGVCKKPTTFQWTQSDPTFRDEVTDIPHEITVRNADLNGDGRDDLITGDVQPNNSFGHRFRFGLAEANGTVGPSFGAFGLGGLPFESDMMADEGGARFVDLNLDGKAEAFIPMVGFYRLLSGGTFAPYYAAGTDVDQFGGAGTRQRLYIGDFTGDGLPDVIRGALQSQNFFAWGFRIGLPQGMPNFYQTFWSSQVNSVEIADETLNSYVVDVDGDGKSEFLFSKTSENRPDAFIPYRLSIIDDLGMLPGGGQGVGSVRGISLRASDRVTLSTEGIIYQFADVNGDGLQDAIELSHLGGDARIAINTGRDFLPPKTVILPTDAKLGEVMDGRPGSYFDNGLRIMDYDGDGRADLFLMASDCGRPHPYMAVVQSRPGTMYNVKQLTQYSTDTPGDNDQICGDFQPRITAALRVLDVNGDGLSDFTRMERVTSPSGQIVSKVGVHIRNGVKPNLLSKVTDGFGHTVDVTYKPITDSTVHTPAGLPGSSLPPCVYPQSCTPRGSMWVVSRLEHDRGDLTHALTYDHKYAGGRTDVSGLGWLGFYSHTVKDVRTEAETETLFGTHHIKLGSNLYPLSGKPTQQTVTTPLGGGRTNKQVTVTTYLTAVNNGGARIANTPGTKSFTETELDDNSTTVKRSSSQTTTYDQTYGYLKSKVVTTQGEQVETTLTYEPDQPEVWLVGIPKRRTVSHAVPTRTFGTASVSAQTLVRTVRYVTDPATGEVAEEIVEPDSQDEDIYLRTVYHRNSAGRIDTVTRTTLDGASRSTGIVYDAANGIFPQAVTNALGHVTTLVHHRGLGLLLASEDANGQRTTQKYDRLGKLLEEHGPDGSFVTNTYSGFAEEGPLQVMRTEQGRAVTSIFDHRGQEIVTETFDDQAGPIRSEIAYDAYGRVVDRWRPHVMPPNGPLSSLPHTHYEYDKLDRLTLETLPPFRKTWTYTGNQTTRTVERDVGTTTDDSVVDFRGQLVHRVERVTDDTGLHDVPTHYFYGPFGVLRQVMDSKGNLTRMDYDLRGRREAILDPDSGTSRDHHDAFDRMTSHTNANQETTAYGYDDLDRLTGESSAGGSSTIIYDRAPNGIGEVAGSIGRDDVTIGYTYNGKGQRDSETWVVAGVSSRIDYGYDTIGRPNGVQYPVVGSSRYAISFAYAPVSGELQSVKDPAGANLWRVTSRNPERNITGEEFGDGAIITRGYEPERGLLTSISTIRGAEQLQALTYHYDRRGYMDRRVSYLDNEEEQFTHDELGRLTRWFSDDWFVRYAYDDIGNMTTRERVTGSTTQELATFTPVGASRPHAVGSSVTNGTTASYGYDSAGRQTSGPGRTIGYTEFDLPRTITKSGSTWNFRYTADHRRALKQGPTGSTIYLGELYERRIAGSTVTHVMYVPGERGVVAQVVQVAGGTPSATYLRDDHLGSIDVAGLTRNKFDPFGRRIATTAPPMSLTAPPLASVTLGFTGQEHDDDLGLVNMNGRIYDPELARFLTPDPEIARPWKSQSFNRYSYVENSPLRLVDPTGFRSSDPDDDGDDDEPSERHHMTAEQIREALLGTPTVPEGTPPTGTGGDHRLGKELDEDSPTSTSDDQNILTDEGSSESDLSLGNDNDPPEDDVENELDDRYAAVERLISDILPNGDVVTTGGMQVPLSELERLTSSDRVGAIPEDVSAVVPGGGLAVGIVRGLGKALGQRALGAIVKRLGRSAGPTIDRATGQQVGRFIVDKKGNAMIEPVGGRTVPAGKGGVDTHTLYPNGSNYQRLNPVGHQGNPTPHGHGHLPGTGPGMGGQGPSIDPQGNVVPWNSGAAHWPIH